MHKASMVCSRNYRTEKILQKCIYKNNYNKEELINMVSLELGRFPLPITMLYNPLIPSSWFFKRHCSASF